jgi:ATP-dependent RNA helicase DHX8/PRP22
MIKSHTCELDKTIGQEAGSFVAGGGDATCTAGFSIGMIKSLLTAADVDRLFSHCFMTYVQKRPLEHSFCPTPDCSTVYNISATGAVFACSQCFVGICTTCKTECHEGQTCEEYQIATNPELDAQNLHEWKDKSGVRTCPNCKATVEKID